MSSIWHKLYVAIGLQTLLHSPSDTKILCLQRLVRLLAYGGSSLVLVLYLTSLGISEQKIGVFMTLTLLGDVVISLMLTVVADAVGRRKMLAFGCLLMTASGITFATCSNYWLLIIAAMLGVISPSGNEIGPFKAIEESTISHLVPSVDRSSVFAWYILVGTLGTSIGTLTGGWVVEAFQKQLHWKAQDAYRMVFWAYSALGLVKFCLALMLGPGCEQEKTSPPIPSDAETQPLLPDQHETDGKDKINSTPLTLRSLFPTLSRDSTSMVSKMCFLFAIDSTASGLMPGSWVSYFYNRKFLIAEGTIGTLFFVGMLVASTSNLAAPALAKRIGLVKTMVYTHIPASIALALIPLSNNAIISMTFFILRSCTNSMDQPPRQAFIAGAVLAEERTAVMGLINVVKTLSQSVGPSFTGLFASHGNLWMAFVIAGSLRLIYDALMLVMFAGYRTKDDRAEATEDVQNHANGPHADQARRPS